MDPKQINERRRADMDKFLATTNTKASIFRDIIIESGKTVNWVISLLGILPCQSWTGKMVRGIK